MQESAQWTQIPYQTPAVTEHNIEIPRLQQPNIESNGSNLLQFGVLYLNPNEKPTAIQHTLPKVIMQNRWQMRGAEFMKS